jgi:nicotinamidase-related amidase
MNDMKYKTRQKMRLITTTIALILGLNLGFAQTDNKMNKALLIIDIQNDYFQGGKAELVNPDKASRNAKLMLEYFRRNNLPVVHVQHISNYPNAAFFVPDTKGAEIHNDVKPKSTEQIIIKHYPNSFRETNLLEYLKSNNITDLVICGMQTHMCVDATTRAAKDFGFNCVVIGDACATKDLEINNVKANAADVQTSFLAALNYYYAAVITTEQYLNKEKSSH